MKRKTILISLFLLAFVSLETSAKEKQTNERPNILWITSEDNGIYLGCYGDKTVKTPNLDKLAEEGIRFDNCFANAPVCSLVRSSWILGVPAATTGTHHMRSAYRVPEILTPYPTLLKEAGYYVTNNSKTDYNNSSFNKEIWDECGHSAHYKNRPKNTPFFAVFNLTVTHEGQIFESLYPKKYNEASIPTENIEIPPYQTNTPETLRDWQRQYERIQDMDSQVGKLITELEKLGEAENTLIFYNSDHGGITLRSKRFLYNSGTHVPFIAYIPEKWQHLLPKETSHVSDRLVQFIDMPKTYLSLCSINVPEYMPGKILLGDEKQKAPEFVYLFSGRFDEAPDMRRGITNGVWKYIRNYEPDRPRFQMLEYPRNQSAQVVQFTEYKKGKTNHLQSAQYKPQGSEELYYLPDDKHEVKNLASDPKFKKELTKLRKQLDKSILEVRDAGFIPEPLMETINNTPQTTLYDFAQSNQDYQLKNILQMANIAQKQDVNNLTLLTDGLSNSDAIIRYWAALGLRALGEQAKPALEDLKILMNDEEPSVRITVAVVLGQLGLRKEALKKLTDELKQSRTDAHANWALDGFKFLEASPSEYTISAKDAQKGRYSTRNYQRVIDGFTMFDLGE